MAKTLSLAELRRMTLVDLQKEIRAQDERVAKLRLALNLGKERSPHIYHAAKQLLAQMRTVENELRQQESSATLASPQSSPQ